MDVQPQPKLIFHGVDIINLQFTAMTAQSDKVVSIDCKPTVFFPAESNSFFHIIMDMKLCSESHFELNLRAVGKFELTSDITLELKKTFINANAPAIMFPYLRSFITTLTANMGQVVGALVVPTQFFNGELEELNHLTDSTAE